MQLTVDGTVDAHCWEDTHSILDAQLYYHHDSYAARLRAEPQAIRYVMLRLPYAKSLEKGG